MLLNDVEITRLATEHSMITPFLPELLRVNEQGTRMISAGLSSFGYDLRVDRTFQVFRPRSQRETHPHVNPKNITSDDMTTLPIHCDNYGEFVDLPPRTFALCHSVETISLPRDITSLLTNKSTYARAGLQVTTTVGEAGWRGQYVLEVYNTLASPLRVYINEGICQLLFIKGIADTSVSYADRNGKYQYQTGITLPIV